MQEYTLILNACEKRVQFVLLEDETFLLAEEIEPQKNGTDTLLSSIQSACKKLSIQPNTIKKVASVHGPGNFMGIRLCTTISSALSRANNALQASLQYMELLAQNHIGKNRESIHIITSATKDLIHSQIFEYDNNMIIPKTKLSLIPLSELYTLATDYILGSGIRNEKINLNEIKAHILPSYLDSPSINSLTHAIKNCIWQKEDIIPIYLKECDAIQNLPHIAKQQGRTLEESKAELNRLLTITH